MKTCFVGGNRLFLNSYFKSIYFDEPLTGRSVGHSGAGLPDWVTGELGGFTDDSLAIGMLKDRPSSTPVATHHRYCSTALTSVNSIKVYF